MRKLKKSKFNLKIRTLIAVIIVTLIGSSSGVIRDTLYDFTISESEKVKIKHINSIHDGDTVNVIADNNKKVKIRLFGIDAPEIKQAFGEESRLCLENMIKNKSIYFIPRDKKKSTDKYGRTVAVLFDGEKNINLEMIKKGCAWNYTQYNKSLFGFFAQISAKNSKSGLWADDNPQAPWDYRHNK